MCPALVELGLAAYGEDCMSRAFVKEDGGAQPPIVPARAPLPDGVPNYVTPRGLALLREELEELAAEQRRLESSGADRAELLALAARRGELESRIASAEVVDRAAAPPSDVRFGATVTVLDESERERTYRIVGVDEADGRESIAFFTPLARALLGRQEGDSTVVRSPRGEETLEVVRVVYATDEPGQGTPR